MSTRVLRSPAGARGPRLGMAVTDAAATPFEDVLRQLSTTAAGLTSEEAQRRLAVAGFNAVRTHHAQPLRVLGRQLRSPVLILLAVTAAVSFFLGETTDTGVIGVILTASVALGFVNEYRAERATDALHSQVSHRVVALRDGAPTDVGVTTLVPGDVVRLAMGEVVGADVRLLSVTGLECNESVLTGESLPVAKSTDPVASGTLLAELDSCALMGTVVHAGSGSGVVVATGADAEFGKIAVGLGERQSETDFQVGLRRFSVLLLQFAAALTSVVLVANLVRHRSLIESLLFSLAIAVGITPQLLPAVVSTALAAGSRSLAKRKVLVKRLVCIEDLGDLDVLVTDKTGTLTEGRITFTVALDAGGAPARRVVELGLLATEAAQFGAGGGVGANALDAALWEAAPHAVLDGWTRIGLLPFDHQRRMTSAVVRSAEGALLLVVKGAPEAVFACCSEVPPTARAAADAAFAEGSRVVAVATRAVPQPFTPTAADETALTCAGLQVFLDRPMASAAAALRRLTALGVSVKVCTGDNPVVAAKVCAELGVARGRTMTGDEMAAMTDDDLAAAATSAAVFARVSPEQKARLVRLLRRTGRAVGFLGDGVNDALALHAADIGVSVDSATDVAKDAADAVLLEKDLDVLADGVTEGSSPSPPTASTRSNCGPPRTGTSPSSAGSWSSSARSAASSTS